MNLLEKKIAWSPDSVDTIGERSMKQMSNALWYLDPHHNKLSSKTIHLPSKLHDFHTFNDWKRKRLSSLSFVAQILIVTYKATVKLYLNHGWQR